MWWERERETDLSEIACKQSWSQRCRPGRALLGWTDGGVSGHISTQHHEVALTCVCVCQRSHTHLLRALVYVHSHRPVFEPVRACPHMSVPAVLL